MNGKNGDPSLDKALGNDKETRDEAVILRRLRPEFCALLPDGGTRKILPTLFCANPTRHLRAHLAQGGFVGFGGAAFHFHDLLDRIPAGLGG